MQFTIPKVTRFLPLQEYAPEEPSLAGVGIHVWVDPPRSVLMEFDQLNQEYNQAFNNLVARLGGEKPKKITLAERLRSWLSARSKGAQDKRFQEATESYRRSINTWYARLWSQSTDKETYWSADELEKIASENPPMYEWLCVSSWVLIEKHREDVKKGCRGPSEKLLEPEGPATPS